MKNFAILPKACSVHFERQELFGPKVSTLYALRELVGRVLNRIAYESILTNLRVDQNDYTVMPVEFAYDLIGESIDVVVLSVWNYEASKDGQLSDYNVIDIGPVFGRVIDAVYSIQVSKCYWVAYIPEFKADPFLQVSCEEICFDETGDSKEGYYSMRVGVWSGFALKCKDHVVVVDSYEGDVFNVQVKVMTLDEFYHYAELPHVNVSSL